MSLRRVPSPFAMLIKGLAVAVVAYASQTSLLTHRDSPIAIILFAALGILLFTLPRVVGYTLVPHVVVFAFGFTTVVAFLLGSQSLLLA
jgi:hypothetical protein